MSHHICPAHTSDHVHGPDCGHERVRHGDHEDYVVGDHLHHAAAEGCIDHGPVPSSAGAPPLESA